MALSGELLMPTTFWGLFLFSTAFSLVATFAAVSVTKLVRLFRREDEEEKARIR
jgi:hypothetical protein